MPVPGNKYGGKSKRDLKDIELRLLSELSNLRVDSKRARQHLESARSCMAQVKYDLGQVEAALKLEAVVQFPAPYIDVEVVQPMEKTAGKKIREVG
jgi:hypothetical protein